MKTKLWAVLSLSILLCACGRKESIAPVVTNHPSKVSAQSSGRPTVTSDDACIHTSDRRFFSGRYQLDPCQITSNDWSIPIPCPGNNDFQLALTPTPEGTYFNIRTPNHICPESIDLFIADCEPSWEQLIDCHVSQTFNYQVYQCRIPPPVQDCLDQWQHLHFTFYYLE